MNYQNIVEDSNLIIINDIYTNGFSINFLEMLTLLSIISSILIITNNNPIISVLFLIALFMVISIYLIIIGLNFIGISYILVYIGAISMLFLFILMLLDIRVSELHIDNNNNIFLSIIIGILFIFLLNNNLNTNMEDVLYNNIIMNNNTNLISYSN